MFHPRSFAVVAGLLSGLVGLGPARGDGTAANSVKAAGIPAPYNWSGFYLGGHFGYGGGSFGANANPVLAQAADLPPTVTGFVGGFQAGYNLQLPNDVVLGLEADVSFIGPRDRPATGAPPFNATFDYFGTVRTRVGRAFGSVLPYLTGGLAWGQTEVATDDASGNPSSSKSSVHVGWTAGAGVEYALGGNWTARIAYDYVDLGPAPYAALPPMPAIVVYPKVHLASLGLNYRLPSGPVAPDGPNPRVLKTSSSPAPDDWSIHGQTTIIAQGYPGFPSPYQGQNSLPGKGQGRETWTATAFVGRSLWDGGEFYFNPELAQGFGVGGTLGLGGFSNGEAQKAGTEYPKVRAQRYFLRQTIGLGGAQESVDDGPNQLGGKRDIDRITITVGRIAIGDIFDANTYAHDPRADFMNWAMWSSAAYDFPADLPGFTRGVVVELNRAQWALRAGLFEVPGEPNSDVLTFRTGGAVAELEERYAVFNQPGKLRIGVFANRGRTGNYRAAQATAADTGVDINAAIVGTRSIRSKNGFYLNAEQSISEQLGVFARASWNDGQNEILSFTDVDRSVSAGVSVKGSVWGRPADTVGVGGAINGLSGAHRQYLAAGGLGLLIGDGALNYREEKIAEAYYAVGVAKWAKLTFDYQCIVNPAYNADRGPVHLFSGRLHAEF